MLESYVGQFISQIMDEKLRKESERSEKKVRISAFISEEDKKKIEYISSYLELNASELIRTLISGGLLDTEKELGLRIMEEKDGKGILTAYGKHIGYERFTRSTED